MNEIKIPAGCKSIKIDQENNNRIVITFEPEKQGWKNGDVLFTQKDKRSWIMIFKDEDDSFVEYHCLLCFDEKDSKNELFINRLCDGLKEFVLANQQQREELFAALEKEGYRWNDEKLEIEKIEWVPQECESCYFVAYDTDTSLFIPQYFNYYDGIKHNKLIKKTELEVQSLCDKLNAAIN